MRQRRFAHPGAVFPRLHTCGEALAIARPVAANDLPEYDVSFVNAANNSPAVHFIRRDAVERAALKADLARLAADSERRAREDARTLAVDGMFEKRRVPPSGER